jgi:hypothetical protein
LAGRRSREEAERRSFGSRGTRRVRSRVVGWTAVGTIWLNTHGGDPTDTSVIDGRPCVVVDDASVGLTNAPQLTWEEILAEVSRNPPRSGDVVSVGVGISGDVVSGSGVAGGVVPSVESVLPAPAPIPVELGLAIARGKNTVTKERVTRRFSVAERLARQQLVVVVRPGEPKW